MPTSPAISLTALSEREQTVLRLLAQGHINKEIARALKLSQNVVDKILSNSSSHYSLYPKIGVANAKGAVAWYLRQVEAADRAEVRPENQLGAPQTPPVAAPSTAEPGDLRGDRGSQGSALFLTAFITIYVALVALAFIPIWLQGGTNAVLAAWGNAYAVLPLIAGIYGLRRLRKPGQGTSKGTLRGLRWLSAGLICWATGVVISIFYFLVTKSVIPYPSLADIGYIAQDICFVAAFGLWWRESHRRGELRSWLWMAIAALTTIGYLAIQHSLRDLGTDFRITPLLPVLELTYASLESICLGIAICFLIPAIARAPATHLQAAFRFIFSGMVVFFLAGTTFGLTANLPEGHWLKFASGNSVDLLFATAFLLMGIGITLAARASQSEAPARGYASFARWGPALISLAALGLAMAPVVARLPTRSQPNVRGEVQIVGDAGRRIRVEANGRILSADETVPAYTPTRITFRVLNNGIAPIVLRSLTIGVRGPGVTCRDKNTIRWSAPDVPFPAATNLTLQPGEMYEYRGIRALYLPGTYFLEPVRQDTAGNWGGIPPFTCVDLTVVNDGR